MYKKDFKMFDRNYISAILLMKYDIFHDRFHIYRYTKVH